MAASSVGADIKCAFTEHSEPDTALPMEWPLELVRARLTSDTEVTGDYAEAETSLVAVAGGATLAASINAALDCRKKGQFNEAIVLITRANRLQLDAIENIQTLADSLLGRSGAKVVFAKYRQVYPFEMGMENADEVLSLFDAVHASLGHSADDFCEAMHLKESERTLEVERLAFFESRFTDGSEDEAIKSAQADIKNLTSEIDKMKAILLDRVMLAVGAFLTEHKVENASYGQRCELSKWLFVLAASPTRTRHADDVEV